MSRRLPVHPDERAPRLVDHPRAQRSIARAKACGGLVGLLLVLLLSLRAHLALEEALLRGLAGGATAYLATWCAAVVVWTQLARAELEDHHRRVLAQRGELGGSPTGTTPRI